MSRPPIPVPGTYNFRDIGGLPADAGMTRSGVLLRSDALGRLGAEGRAALVRLGIGTVIDLRSHDEIEQSPDDLEGLDLHWVNEPIFQGSVASQLSATPSLIAIYDHIVARNGARLTDAVRVIATREHSVLVHCTAGKDRTGIVVALALLAVGVERAAVVDDYAQTEANLAGDWMVGMRTVLAGYSVAETPQLLELLGGSPAAAIDGVIDHVEASFGTAAEYLRAHGLAHSDLDRLRSRLLT